MEGIIDAFLPTIIRTLGNSAILQLTPLDISGENPVPRERDFATANGAVLAVIIVLVFVVFVLTILVIYCIKKEREARQEEKKRAARGSGDDTFGPGGGSSSTTSSEGDHSNSDEDSPRNFKKDRGMRSGGGYLGVPEKNLGVDGEAESPDSSASGNPLKGAPRYTQAELVQQRQRALEQQRRLYNQDNDPPSQVGGISSGYPSYASMFRSDDREMVGDGDAFADDPDRP